MDPWQRILLQCGGQVALFSAAAAVTLGLCSRRPILAGSVAATSLLCIVLLTPAALFGLSTNASWLSLAALPDPPIPARPVVSAGPARRVPDAQPGPASAADTGATNRPIVSFVVPAWFSTRLDGASAHWQSWLGSLATGIAILTAAVAFRLLLVAVRTAQIVRRSSQIDDRGLSEHFAHLQAAVGCHRRVELRSCPAIATAATCGWWRPVILIAASWKSWSRQERTAILAHELTHVRERDCAWQMLARIAVAMHVYNPFIHWLARNLVLTQESRADFTAAAIVGSRRAYLVTLCRFALRQDRLRERRPAPAFTSFRSQPLIRRIAMLKTTEGRSTAPSQGLRLATCIALAALAGLATTVRAPADESATATSPRNTGDAPVDRDNGPPTDRAGIRLATATPVRPDDENREPFDFSYVASDADRSSEGVIAIRPSALSAARPLKPWVGAIDAQIASTLKALQVPSDNLIELADIDQLVGTVNVDMKDPNGPPGERGTLQLGFSLIRSAQPFDFKKLVTAVVPGSVEKEIDGIDARVIDALSYTLLMPDPKTLAVLGIDAGASSPQSEGSGRTFGTGAALFSRVALSDVALVVNTDRETWAEFEGVDPLATQVLARIRDFDSIAIGLELTPRGVKIRGYARLTEAAAEKGESESLAALEQDRGAAVTKLSEISEGEHAALAAAATEILAGLTSERQDDLVVWTSFVTWDRVSPLAEFAAASLESR